MTVYVLYRGQPVGPFTSEHLEVFASLEHAQAFPFTTKPMLPNTRYEWRQAPFDADRWLLLDLSTLEPLANNQYTIVAKRLIR